jgi:RNA polymerase sigma-70 factor (ECF subfamily)
VAALRAERALARQAERGPESGVPSVDHLPADDPGVSSAFDRAWAEAMVRRAGQRQRERAGQAGPPAERRVELLRLRFEDGLPIREIAQRWNEDPDHVHHEYAKARREFREALLDVVAEHHPGATPEEVAAEAEKLLKSLS